MPSLPRRNNFVLIINQFGIVFFSFTNIYRMDPMMGPKHCGKLKIIIFLRRKLNYEISFKYLASIWMERFWQETYNWLFVKDINDLITCKIVTFIRRNVFWGKSNNWFSVVKYYFCNFIQNFQPNMKGYIWSHCVSVRLDIFMTITSLKNSLQKHGATEGFVIDSIHRSPVLPRDFTLRKLFYLRWLALVSLV